ncbi:DegT/DnrJ/EryC1/StrS family aminotransferase [Streptomyces sp. NBC_00893]|uniref:DegT/DnrJ/EryC1/StrS family aminotransferase n=1 Tax=Streptomyces sp. NBC_00893 TaxID=2975862 RepID=UPI002254A36F|nr:DegT/DnrJ/EryC1/StrS family aminotransferase [Streptomyces sp. NBC_00893]MCX4851549.1 DegT/DnrJ/EryC1/StrS family aminotransferase [Streptomyces sp. NBC_00893]
MNADALRAPDLPAWPQYGDEERVGLIRALEQGQWWRIGGSEVDSFEQEFGAFHGTDHALAVTSGTHALELGLEVLGVKPGDEVIVPAFTFFASSLAAQRLGAVPVLVDVDPDTYCIDPSAVEAAIGPRTRAIMPVHMAGQIADMDALEKLAADAGVPLLQDAAHAHGARWQGKRVGELGSVAAFSFQNGKLMTAGEGGALLFPEAELREEAFVRHSCGRPATDRKYFHRSGGSNYRIGEFAGSVLRAQLGRLDEQVSVREERWALLHDLLAGIPGVVPQGRDTRCDRNPHYMAMFRLPGIAEERRNQIVDELLARNVPAFVGFRALYRTDGFWAGRTPEGASVDSIARACPDADAISVDCLWLHHRTLLGSAEDMHAVAEVVAHVVRRARA